MRKIFISILLILNILNIVASDLIYTNKRYIHKDLFVVQNKNLVGLLCEDQLVLPIEYKKLTFDNDDSIIYLVDKYGIHSSFNINTKKIINEYHPFYLKEIKTQNSITYCLVDSNRNFKTHTFDKIYPFKSGRALAKIGYKVGFIDSCGNFNAKSSYENARIIKDFLGYILEKELHIGENKIKNIYCLLDSNYNELIAFESGYENIDHVFTSSLLIVKKDNYYGLVNFENKKEITPIIYDHIEAKYVEEGTGGTGYSFENGMFLITQWDGFMYIDVKCFYAKKNNQTLILSPSGKIWTKIE